MRELPAGTVTFLFTDVEGSTRLLHELGDRYAAVPEFEGAREEGMGLTLDEAIDYAFSSVD